MFKSKSFTAAFIALSVLIAGLIVVLCMLLFGKGKEMLTQSILVGTMDETEAPSSEIQTTPESTEAPSILPEDTTESETESETETESEEKTSMEEIVEDTSIRALKADEPHTYPIINENIHEYGVITIVKSGDNGEGIVFHKLPQFDASSAEGNEVRYGGSFDITEKIFIMNNDRPFLMYRTQDGFYCTSSTVYMGYQARDTMIKPNPGKIGAFGVNENEGIQVVIHCDDGNHVVFSVFNYNSTSAQTSPVLENVIAQYNSIGVASFEYHFSDGKIYTGTISFENVNDSLGKMIIDLNFPIPMSFAAGERTEVVLHK